MTALFTALIAFAIGLGVDAIPQYDTHAIEYTVEYAVEEQDIQQDIPETQPAPYIEDDDIPEWCHTEWHHGESECGCCGAHLTDWKTIRNYYNTKDVDVCGDCWTWACAETAVERRASQEFLSWKTGREFDMVGIEDGQRDEVSALVDGLIADEQALLCAMNDN